jgi:hypothetical protein
MNDCASFLLVRRPTTAGKISFRSENAVVENHKFFILWNTGCGASMQGCFAAKGTCAL